MSELNWLDFPRKADTVAIVGFSPTSRELAPYDKPPEEVEIWGLNEEYNFPWMKRWDRWFQIHQRWDFERTNNMNDANHQHWLKNSPGQCLVCSGTGKFVPLYGKNEIECPVCKDHVGVYIPDRRTDFPIYMQRSFADIPGSVSFPMDDATKLLGRKYYRSGFSYMMTLAVLMGYSRIEIYGFEMGSNSEYHYQKANGEWLIGYAMGKGIDVYLPEICSLLKGPVYGYEDSRIGMRQNLETRTVVLDNQFKRQKEAVMRLDAQAVMLNDLIQHPEWNLKDVLTKVAGDYNKAAALMNFVRGAKTETENITQMYDKYFTGPSEEEDPVAYQYRIVTENVKVEYAQEEEAKPAGS